VFSLLFARPGRAPRRIAWTRRFERNAEGPLLLVVAFRSLVFGAVVPQLAAGKDYIEFLLDGADGYSESCQRLFFYPPGMRDDALEQLCGRDDYAETAFPTPSGEAGIPALQANTVATIGNVGPTPVLLVFSDRDALFPGPALPRRGSRRRDARDRDVAVRLQLRGLGLHPAERGARRPLPQDQQAADRQDPRLAPRQRPHRRRRTG
jgi:hypothetical protein